MKTIESLQRELDAALTVRAWEEAIETFEGFESYFESEFGITPSTKDAPANDDQFDPCIYAKMAYRLMVTAMNVNVRAADEKNASCVRRVLSELRLGLESTVRSLGDGISCYRDNMRFYREIFARHLNEALKALNA